MSIFDNTVSLTAYRVVLPMENNNELIDTIRDGLTSHLFKSIEHTTEQASTGWIPQGATTDFTFTDTSRIQNAPFIFFSIRRDVRAIPYAAKQFAVAEREKAWREQNPGIKRIPKAQKAYIDDAVTHQLLEKTIPSPNMVDVVWDITTGKLLLTTTSPKWLDIFETLWQKSFPDFLLRAATPFDYYYGALPAEKQEGLEVPESYMEALDLYPHIGRDFLLWLTYQSAEGNCQYPSSICVADNKLILIDEVNKKHSIAISGEQHTYSEVIAALAAGKSIAQANIKFQVDENEYHFVLKGKTFQFESFKCPKVRIETDATVDALTERQAVFYERMALLETGFGLFSEVLTKFATLHSENWPAEYEKIHKWFSGE